MDWRCCGCCVWLVCFGCVEFGEYVVGEFWMEEGYEFFGGVFEGLFVD